MKCEDIDKAFLPSSKANEDDNFECFSCGKAIKATEGYYATPLGTICVECGKKS